MVSVPEAEQIIMGQCRDYGSRVVTLVDAVGHVLAEPIVADRDLPPFNRVTMDGIAINFQDFEQGIRKFRIAGIQAAGQAPIINADRGECVEIMTGAALPDCFDTVVRYEDIKIDNGWAEIIFKNITARKNVHYRGEDKAKDDVLVAANSKVTPAVCGIAASVGKSKLMVKELPRIAIISTGDELTEIDDTPGPYQVRKSNVYAIRAALQAFPCQVEIGHTGDSPEATSNAFSHAFRTNDVLIISGGISMGKYDYVYESLEQLGAKVLIHKVAQRPGKPFSFAVMPSGQLIFAFPGNPVSAFLCLYRYFIPWLQRCLNLELYNHYAALAEEIVFAPPLHFFAQVRLSIAEDGRLLAHIIEGNGSGDFSNLAVAQAFIELPPDREHFSKGELYRIWPFSF